MAFLKSYGTSLVAQWIGIHLPMQRTGVQSLIQEDSTCHVAAEPVQLLKGVPRTCAPPVLSLSAG